jgi:hypothetical protein
MMKVSQRVAKDSRDYTGDLLGRSGACPGGVGSSHRAQALNNRRITEAGQNDVLFGRGKPFQFFPGNLYLHKLTDLHRKEYSQAARHDKNTIADRIIRIIKAKSGRFLKREHEGEDYWVAVTDTVSRAKVAHILRGKPRKTQSSADTASESRADVRSFREEVMRGPLLSTTTRGRSHPSLLLGGEAVIPPPIPDLAVSDHSYPQVPLLDAIAANNLSLYPPVALPISGIAPPSALPPSALSRSNLLLQPTRFIPGFAPNYLDLARENLFLRQSLLEPIIQQQMRARDSLLESLRLRSSFY